MKDIALDKTTHDLLIQERDLVLASDLNWVRQKLKTRLAFIYEEWFLDSTQGIKYFDSIAVKNPDLSLVDSIIRATILDTDNVTGLLKYTSTFNPAQRSLSVSFKAQTDFGNITMSESL